MAEMEGEGWTKQHRSLFRHPVWRRPPAAMLFLWLIGAAAFRDREDTSFGPAVRLRRGQLLTSYAEMARLNPFSIKQIRGAVAFLEKEGMIASVDLRRLHCSLITVTNYESYQACEPESLLPIETKDASGTAPKTGQSKGQGGGQSESAEKGKAKKRGNALGHSEKSVCGLVGGAERGGAEGQSEGQGKGRTNNKVEEVNKNINSPNPLFSKGGRVCSSSDFSSDASAMLGAHRDRYRMVLAMWREERLAAGLDFQEDKPTADAAEKLAREYLAEARLSPDRLRRGMRKLVAVIKGDAKCARYTLRALARNPSAYCPPPPIPKPARRRVRWRMVCEVCGHALFTEWFAADAPEPPAQECARATGRNGAAFEFCQGWMLTADREEKEA